MKNKWKESHKSAKESRKSLIFSAEQRKWFFIVTHKTENRWQNVFIYDSRVLQIALQFDSIFNRTFSFSHEDGYQGHMERKESKWRQISIVAWFHSLSSCAPQQQKLPDGKKFNFQHSLTSLMKNGDAGKLSKGPQKIINIQNTRRTSTYKVYEPASYDEHKNSLERRKRMEFHSLIYFLCCSFVNNEWHFTTCSDARRGGGGVISQWGIFHR